MNRTTLLKEIIEEIPLIKSLEDARYILCKLSLTFEKEDIKKQPPKEYFLLFLKIIDAVFKNDVFYQMIERTTYKVSDNICEDGDTEKLTREDKDKTDKDYIEEKKLILLFLKIGLFCPALFLERLNHSFIKDLRIKLATLNRDIERNANYRFSYENIIMNFTSIVYEPKYRFNDTFPLKKLGVKMGEQMDADFLFQNSQKTGFVIVVSFVSLPYFKFISKCLRDDEEVGIGKKISKLYGVSAVSEKRIEKELQRYSEKFGDNTVINNYISSFRTSNERSIGYIINRVTRGISHNKNSFEDTLKTKLEEIPTIKAEIISYCTNNLAAFNSNLDKENNERSNKIFIVTIELLAVLEVISKAKDRGRTRSSAIRALHLWLERINTIINKYELIDDRDQIKDFLVEENDVIEWKTNFFTPTEDLFINSDIEKKKGEEIFLKIIKSIIGMMNTNGGNIIIGLSEHPEKIVRDGIINNTIKKDGFTFYDIGHELKEKHLDADEVKRRIQDKIKKETQLDIDKTDKNRKIIPLELIDEENLEKRIMIFKIKVEKGKEDIYCVDNNKNTSISLIKRVNGRTIFVDPRDYL